MGWEAAEEMRVITTSVRMEEVGDPMMCGFVIGCRERGVVFMDVNGDVMQTLR